MPSTSSPTFVFHRIFVSSNGVKSKENKQLYYQYNRITSLFIEEEEQGISLSLKSVDPPPWQNTVLEGIQEINQSIHFIYLKALE